MDFLTRLSMSKNRFTLAIMIILLISSVFSFMRAPRREDPEISIRTAVIAAQNPAMDTEEIKDFLALPIERKAQEISNVDEVRSFILNGSVQVFVNLDDEVKTSDLEAIWQDLRNKMSEITLPDGSYGPFVNTDYGDIAIATYALSADGFSMRELQHMAEEFQRILYTVDGISKVNLYGVQKEQVELVVDTRKMVSTGLDLRDILNQIEAQNQLMPIGKIIADGYQIRIETTGDFENIDQIKNMLIKLGEDDSFIRLDDIVDVKRILQDPPFQPVYYNSKPAITIAAEMADGQNIAELAGRLEVVVNDFEQHLPIGYELGYSTYQPPLVVKAVNQALSNVVQTFLVVFAIVVFFVGLRAGFIISAIVPLSISFTLIGMNLMGIELESVSIAGIIISLGLLVDNGVVIVQNIQTLINEEHMEPSDAARATAKRYAMPLLASSFTTIFAFLPMTLLPGMSGEVAFSLGGVVMATLLGSWISGMAFLTFLSSALLSKNAKVENMVSEKSKNKPSILQRLSDIYSNLILFILSPIRAALVIVVCLVCVLLAMPLMGTLKKEMFPYLDRTELLVYMSLPAGASTQQTAAKANEITHWFMDKNENPNVANVTTYVSAGGPRFNLSLNPADAQSHTAFMLINATSQQEAVALEHKASEYLRSYFADVDFYFQRLAIGTQPGTVELRLYGEDPNELLQRAQQLKAQFAKVPAINRNQDNWGGRVPILELNIDQEKAKLYGLDSQSIATFLYAYLEGLSFSVYREDDKELPIRFRESELDRDSLTDLTNILIPSNAGNIALTQITQPNHKLGYHSIRRINQELVITVTAQANDIQAADLFDYIKPHLEAMDWSGGFRYELRGELHQSAESNENLASLMPIMFVLIIMTILFNFNSFRRTIIVIASIPLVIIGVPVGLSIMSMPFSFYATLAIIALAGIVVNNAIVMTEAIDTCRQQDSNLKTAIATAAKQRLVPILMTTSTAVFGLIPMALAGGPQFEPMAIAIMFGLGFAAALILFYVPSLYYLLFRNDKAVT